MEFWIIIALFSPIGWLPVMLVACAVRRDWAGVLGAGRLWLLIVGVVLGLSGMTYAFLELTDALGVDCPACG